METESAIKLVKELKQNKLLPKYNEALLNEIASQVVNSYKYLNEEWIKKDINDEANIPLPVVMKLTSERNVRCALAYL